MSSNLVNAENQHEMKDEPELDVFDPLPLRQEPVRQEQGMEHFYESAEMQEQRERVRKMTEAREISILRDEADEIEEEVLTRNVETAKRQMRMKKLRDEAEEIEEELLKGNAETFKRRLRMKKLREENALLEAELSGDPSPSSEPPAKKRAGPPALLNQGNPSQYQARFVTKTPSQNARPLPTTTSDGRVLFDGHYYRQNGNPKQAHLSCCKPNCPAHLTYNQSQNTYLKSIDLHNH